MKRYWIYYDGFGKPFCQKDTQTGDIFDPQGAPMRKLPDYVYTQWEQGGGRIEKQDALLGQENQSVDRSSPPEGLDEFEYIDWQITH